jgi:DNA excision repair protein ERCC-4
VRAGLDKDARAEDQAFNQEPQDMLAVVPGVTPQNIKSIVMNAENIRDVANMTDKELQPLVGATAGRQIKNFFLKNVMEEA